MAIKENEVWASFSHHVDHFISLGYDLPREKNKKGKWVTRQGSRVLVKIEHLPDNAANRVTKICDSCGIEIKGQIYNQILKDRVNNKKGIDQCSGCTRRDKIRNYNKTENLKVKRIDLSNEWHPTKNMFSPENYLPKSTDSVWWICRYCNIEFEACIHKRNKTGGCSSCNSPKSEKEVIEILKNLKVEYKLQHSYRNLYGNGGGRLRFDFAIIQDGEIKFLIEHDGMSHHHFNNNIKKDQFFLDTSHDVLKDNYCIENNIPLFRIPFWEFENTLRLIKIFCGYYEVLNENYKTEEIDKYMVNSKKFVPHIIYYNKYIKNNI